MPSDIAQTEQIVTEINNRRLPGKSTYNFVDKVDKLKLGSRFFILNVFFLLDFRFFLP